MDWLALAADVWVRLVALAAAQKTTTYGELGGDVGLHHRSLRLALDPIMRFCRDEGLPPLTILVVNKHTRKPGVGIGDLDGDDVETATDRVFRYNWQVLANPMALQGAAGGSDAIIKQLLSRDISPPLRQYLVAHRGAGQAILKQALIRAYNGACAVCGLSLLPALEAAHIIRYSACTPEERFDVSNSLLLCAVHHRLYDATWLGIKESGEIDVDPDQYEELSADHQMHGRLVGSKIRRPVIASSRPSRALLARRYKEDGWPEYWEE